jgi:LmbE family N-acetylglucosaminyl deacetylase
MMRAGDILAGFEHLPEADLVRVVGDRFAVIAPHPDDESLGCGGMIAEACRRGMPPDVVVLTDGAASHPGSSAYPPALLALIRKRETRRAMACLGLPAHKLHFLNVPDGATPHDEAGLADIVRDLCAVVADCDTLLVTWRHDPHCDHLAAYLAVRAAADILSARVLEYPVWGLTLADDVVLPPTPWRGWRVNMAAQLTAKRAAIACHESQHGKLVRDDPSGFVLPADFLSRFDRDWEILLEAA